MPWPPPPLIAAMRTGRTADRELVVSRGCRAGSPTMVTDCVTEGTKTPPERLSLGAAQLQTGTAHSLLQMTQLWASARGRRFSAQAAQIGGSRSLSLDTAGARCGGQSGRRPAARLTVILVGRWLPGCSGDECGDDVGRVPVQAGAGAVVAHSGARVGVGGGFLYVAERDPGVEGGSDEGVPQGVRADVLADARAAGHAPDDAGGAVPVQSPPGGGDEERPVGALADRQVDRPRYAGRAGW